MKMFYIAHPFTGDEAKNRFKVKKIKKILQSGYPQYCFVSPIDEFGEYNLLHYSDVLALCFELLSRSDGIVLCDGWENSKGCVSELAYAKQNEMEIRYFYGNILSKDKLEE